jgi:beta-glucosidase
MTPLAGLLALGAALAAHGAAAQTAANTAAQAHPALWPTAHSTGLVDPATEARITALMAGMSLEEKVGQMIQADIGSITPEDLRHYPLGSILAGAARRRSARPIVRPPRHGRPPRAPLTPLHRKSGPVIRRFP